MTWGMSNWWDCTVPQKDVNYKALIEWMEKEQVFKELKEEIANIQKHLTTPLQRKSLDFAIKLLCFACGAMLLKTRAVTEGACNCPVDWQNTENYCLHPGSYYDQYYVSVNRSRKVTVRCARVAKKISKLPWKRWEEK